VCALKVEYDANNREAKVSCDVSPNDICVEAKLDETNRDSVRLNISNYWNALGMDVLKVGFIYK